MGKAPLVPLARFGNDGVEFACGLYLDADNRFLTMRSPTALEFRKIFYYIGIHGTSKWVAPQFPEGRHWQDHIYSAAQFAVRIRSYFEPSKRPAIFLCACDVGYNLSGGFAVEIARILRVPVLAADRGVKQFTRSQENWLERNLHGEPFVHRRNNYYLPEDGVPRLVPNAWRLIFPDAPAVFFNYAVMGDPLMAQVIAAYKIYAQGLSNIA